MLQDPMAIGQDLLDLFVIESDQIRQDPVEIWQVLGRAEVSP